MTIKELAAEYEAQERLLQEKLDALRPLLCVYRGKDLYLLRKKIILYYDMAVECKHIAATLRAYEEDEKNEIIS